MKISTTFDQIDVGSVALPEFQRGNSKNNISGIKYEVIFD